MGPTEGGSAQIGGGNVDVTGGAATPSENCCCSPNGDGLKIEVGGIGGTPKIPASDEEADTMVVGGIGGTPKMPLGVGATTSLPALTAGNVFSSGGT